MKKFRDGLLGPTVILFLICFIITFALAAVYNVTEPIIEQGEIAAANAARQQVLPEGDTFSRVDAALPEGVSDAYVADNGAGYVFTSQSGGFGGDVVYMIGMDADGAVVGITMFSHEETPGLGTKVASPDYLNRYLGQADPAAVDSVDAVSGATRTTNSLKNSLKQAFEAYNAVKKEG